MSTAPTIALVEDDSLDVVRNAACGILVLTKTTCGACAMYQSEIETLLARADRRTGPCQSTLKHSVTVDRPIEEVWAFMDDLANYPKWATGLSEIRQTTDGPKGVGTRLVWIYVFLDQHLEMLTEVTEFEPNRIFAALMSAGPVHLRGTWKYEPIDGKQTRITTLLDGETGGVFSVADPLVARALHRQMEASYTTLKDLLEARVPA
jgi:uncharacterized membrane protein